MPRGTTKPRVRIGVSWACRLGVAGLFGLAAWPKIAAPDRFAEAVAAYELLTPWMIGPTAWIVPWLELLAAAALLGPARLRRAGGIVLAALLVGFTGAIVWALAQGLDVACGCFGEGWFSPRVSGWHVARNVGLLGAIALGLAWAQRRGASAMPTSASASIELSAGSAGAQG